MKIFTILLLGYGNIGKRHLESILNSKFKAKIEITIIDNDIKKLKDIKNNSKLFNFDNFEINSHKKLYLKNNKYNLCIIATNSSERLYLLRKISHIKFDTVIIEKLIADNLKNLNKIEKVIKKSSFKKVYVNTPRRYMDVYKNIKKDLNLSKPLSIFYTATNFKLASNSIHIIDLFQFFIGDKNIKSIFCQINKIVKSKKKYSEFEGILIFSDKNNNTLYINNAKQNVTYRTSFGGVKILNYPKSFIFNEASGDILEIKENLQNSKIKYTRKHGKFTLQSEMTKNYVEDLMKNKNLNLPTFDLSCESHKIYYQALYRALLKKNINLNSLKIT